MSEIRINIIDQTEAISGERHGSFGEALVAGLTAEPETIDELEIALQRFIERTSDWSWFRRFSRQANFEPYDAGILVIDLAARVLAVDSTYSSFSREGNIRIKTDDEEDFWLPYRLPDDWRIVNSIPEYKGVARARREERLKNSASDARQILFGKPLFEFIVEEYLASKNSKDENLFADIHAKWLMAERMDLQGRTPRELLLEKKNFIGFDLHSRFLQWSFTKQCPLPLSKQSNAYLFAGFGTHENVIYYDFIRFLLNECFSQKITERKILEKIAQEWLSNPNKEFSGRTPAGIIEAERRRINLTMSAHECLIDEDCEMCEMMAAAFDMPMLWGLDGSNMEYDRFEFSFAKTRAEWEEKCRREREFDLKFSKGKDDNSGFFDDDETFF